MSNLIDWIQLALITLLVAWNKIQSMRIDELERRIR